MKIGVSILFLTSIICACASDSRKNDIAKNENTDVRSTIDANGNEEATQYDSDGNSPSDTQNVLAPTNKTESDTATDTYSEKDAKADGSTASGMISTQDPANTGSLLGAESDTITPEGSDLDTLIKSKQGTDITTADGGDTALPIDAGEAPETETDSWDATETVFHTDSMSENENESSDNDHSLVGKTFVLDFRYCQWLLPSQFLGIDLSEFLPLFAISIVHVSDSDSALGVLGSVENLNGNQDTCSEAVSIDATIGFERHFDVIFEYRNLELMLEGPTVKQQTTIFKISITGEFSNTWQTLYAEFSAWLNISEIHGLFNELEDNSPEGVCNAVQTQTSNLLSCEPCPERYSNPGDICIPVRATDVTANGIDMTLSEVYGLDIDWEACL